MTAKKMDLVIARLLANTRRRKRPNNIEEVAEDIKFLQAELGSLKKVSELVGVSGQMLRKFLSIDGLMPEIKGLIRSRKIDSVASIDILRRFNPEDQKAIAEEILGGKFGVDNMKVLSALYNIKPSEDIHCLMSKVKASENKKIFVLKFKVPKSKFKIEELKSRINKMVGRANIVSFDISRPFATLEINAIGKKNLMQQAKDRKLSLKGLFRDMTS
jgi:hypothetical protein